MYWTHILDVQSYLVNKSSKLTLEKSLSDLKKIVSLTFLCFMFTLPASPPKQVSVVPPGNNDICHRIVKDLKDLKDGQLPKHQFHLKCPWQAIILLRSKWTERKRLEHNSDTMMPASTLEVQCCRRFCRPSEAGEASRQLHRPTFPRLCLQFVTPAKYNKHRYFMIKYRKQE